MRRGREQRTQGRGQTTNNTQVRMHGWDDAYEADLSHRCDVKPMCINGRRAVCSSTACCARPLCAMVFLVVHRIVLKHDVVMRKGVRNVVAIKAEIEFYRGNWWIHSNVARVDSLPGKV